MLLVGEQFTIKHRPDRLDLANAGDHWRRAHTRDWHDVPQLVVSLA
ncbi:hypothetical protein LWC34_37920 [Kibdelosporangium philippinense]|uniref:Uncharacterized protein n=1 Tax=Kibdelosporangium philippinense TaxID=211113 RepID=A0ABS8ZL77_9PSEU|nr:hypothetical protein [Kibdelosporangium philippinense]